MNAPFGVLMVLVSAPGHSFPVTVGVGVGVSEDCTGGV